MSVDLVRRISAILEYADSYISGKIFVYAWICGTTSSWFSSEHKLIGKIPFVSSIFGITFASGIMVIVILSSILEPVVLSLLKVYAAFLPVRFGIISPGEFVLGMPLLIILLWIILG